MTISGSISIIWVFAAHHIGGKKITAYKIRPILIEIDRLTRKLEDRHVLTLVLSTRYARLEDNMIGSQGCKHLSKAKLWHLDDINLSKQHYKTGGNRIGDEGCQHLAKANWDIVNFTTLSTIIMK